LNRRDLLSGMIVPFALPVDAKAAICSRIDRGRYVGRLRFGRYYPNLFQLIEPYAFIDSCGKNWSAPVEALTDGASIPRVAQIFVGDPYSGPYLDAAVIHDWFCAVRTEPYEEVHRMFYNAMIVSQVGETLAQIMYTAVCWKGPKWDNLTVQNNRLRMRQNPTSFIKSPPLPAPPPPPMPTPFEVPPEQPDLNILAESRRALAANDTARAGDLLSLFETQSTAYDSYVQKKEFEQSDKIAIENSYRARLASEEAEKQKEIQKFQALLVETSRGNKSLDEIAIIASNFPT
jgi:hypothetical protein